MAAQPIDETAERTPLRRIGGVLLRIWLSFHLFAIICWAIPQLPQGVQLGTAPPRLRDWPGYVDDLYFRPSKLNDFSPTMVQHYLLFTGFWQTWDMFAPDPSDTDIWGDAVVQYKNGDLKVHAYPRMYDLPIPMKYLKERYRKFFERAGSDSFSYLWPVFAQRIALEAFEMGRERDNPPIRVWLRIHRMPLPKPGSPLPDNYLNYVYFDFKVDQAALQRDARF